MLFADELATTWPQVVSMLGTAAVAAWLAIERYRVASRVEQLQNQAVTEKARCDALADRVHKLEGMLRSFVKRRPKK